ncbi:ABC transporter permease [Parvularcula sp. ZS-1/3]|uniref:ABC transporter permease n=1 Tax=Parvularcula mediterranea TaxID=2732508 RepID=A0A7Y3W5C3_9PROT|nr:ABC transporter permease [Parvularcula mediterranea]NNU16464.1 ABC transporter permease [Parvularcula mediterranea]
MSALFEIISHEYRKYVFTKGFIAFLLLIPFAMVFGVGVVMLQEATESAKTFTVIDRTGQYEEIIQDAVDTNRERRILQRYDEFVLGLESTGLVDGQDLKPPFRPDDRTDARREAFFEQGGLEEGSRQLKELVATDLPPIEAPRERYRIVDLELELPADASADVIGEAYAPYMRGDEDVPGGGRLTGVVLIPEAFGQEEDAEAVYLTDNLNDESIATFVRRAISDDLQRKAFLAEGLSEEDVVRITGLNASLRTVKAGTQAEDVEQRRRDRIETLLPFGLAYILFFGAFSVGSMLLTNTIEEKSNKIVEMLLSSVSAGQLMVGKLVALALVGLTPMVFFGAVGIAVLTFFGAGDEFFGLVRDVLLGSPLVPFFFLYFVLGYMLIGAVYLGIGALCETIQDAQNLSTPLTFLVLLPTFAFAGIIVDDPNGVIAKVLTFIPLYSHVTMMLRLSSNPPMWEIIAGTTILAGSALLLIGFMGRIYRAGILQSGGKATWKGMLDAARASKEDSAR